MGDSDREVLIYNDWTDRNPVNDVTPETDQSAINRGDEHPREHDSHSTRSDPRRWYILLVFSLISMTQGGIWNSYSPISGSVNAAFGWGDSTIAFINVVAIVSYLIFTPLFSWVMDVKGLRLSVLVSSLLLAVGAGLRCITSSTPHVTWLAYVACTFNGAAGPVAFGGIALVSAVWFPAHQRVAATSISAALNGIGVAIPFLLAPALVPQPNNNSTHPNATTIGLDNDGSKNVTNIAEIKYGFMIYMYTVCGWCMCLLLATFIYFPSKPRCAPSVSAAVERQDFKSGVLQLLKSSKFWCLGGTYAVSNGVFQAWIAVMNLNLAPLGIKEDESGIIGFIAQCTGMVASIGVGVFSAVFARRMKVFLIGLYTLGLVMFLVFALLCYNVIPFHIAIIYTTVIVGSICLSGAVPLFFELTCEAAYPIAEGVTNGFVTGLNNIAALVFMLGLMVPDKEPLWMAWALVASTAVCLPFFFVIHERYGRLDVDEEEEEEDKDRVVET